jgi:hypothetical protein
MATKVTFASAVVSGEDLQRALGAESGYEVDLKCVVVQDVTLEDYCCVGPNGHALAFEGDLGAVVNRAWNGDTKIFHFLMPFTQGRPKPYRTTPLKHTVPDDPEELVAPYKDCFTRLDNDMARVEANAPFQHRAAAHTTLTMGDLTDVIKQHRVHDHVVDLTGGIATDAPPHAKIVFTLSCFVFPPVLNDDPASGTETPDSF